MELTVYGRYGQELITSLSRNGRIRTILEELVNTDSRCAQLFQTIRAAESMYGGVRLDATMLAVEIQRKAIEKGYSDLSKPRDLGYILKRVGLEKDYFEYTAAGQYERRLAIADLEKAKGLHTTAGHA